MEFYSERSIKSAKKEHICHICGGKIEIGAGYIKESGKHNGEMFDRCTCHICYVVRSEFCSKFGNEYDKFDIDDFARSEVCSKCELWDNDECDLHWSDCDKVVKHYMMGE